MIYKLQRKFILISAISIFAVVLLIIVAFGVINYNLMNKTLDTLAESISHGGGRFPDSFGAQPTPPDDGKQHKDDYGFINPETPYSTRYFTVWLDTEGELLRVDRRSIFSVSESEAYEYAKDALAKGEKTGWISNFRYRCMTGEKGYVAVFVDGSMNRASFAQSLLIVIAVLLVSASIILILIIIFSKKVMRPVAESYEKQKQFITDANHELKTPLTLILANLDIAEGELGENEWLQDIRGEAGRMTELVDHLVVLSRMDEAPTSNGFSSVALGEIVFEASSEFSALAELRGKRLECKVEKDICVRGDEMLLRRLIGILLDNAVKYCDEGGEILVCLKKKGRALLTVENTYAEVKATELDRLFERFYRADKARSAGGGYGIGLSIAKAIVESHKGEISAYRKDSEHIGFKVALR